MPLWRYQMLWNFLFFFHFDSLYMRYLGVIFFIGVHLGSHNTSVIHTLILFTSVRKFWAIIYSNIDLVLCCIYFLSCRTQIPYMINFFPGLYVCLSCSFLYFFFNLLCFTLGISTHASSISLHLSPICSFTCLLSS